MYHMLPYYAGVYAYDYLAKQPDFPIDNKKFMELWEKMNLSEWSGKAGQAPQVTKKKFGWDDLATIDDTMREDAIQYIKAHAKDEKPFFMYLCFMKVHNPNNPSPRFERKSPGSGSYLDSLMELDDNSGQVLQAIRDAGIAENTLVVWTTDNGAWIDAWPDAGYTPFRGMKGTAFEGGFRVPCMAWWPGHIKAGTVANEMMSHLDWWPTLSSSPAALRRPTSGRTTRATISFSTASRTATTSWVKVLRSGITFFILTTCRSAGCG